MSEHKDRAELFHRITQTREKTDNAFGYLFGMLEMSEQMGNKLATNILNSLDKHFEKVEGKTK